MTEQPTEFRVGSVFGRTCRIFARHFIKFSPVTAIAVMPSVLMFPNPRSPLVETHLPVLATLQLLVFTMLFSQAVVVLCVFDDLHGRSVSLVAGVAASLRRFFSIAGLAFGVGVLTAGVAGFATMLAQNPRSGTAVISLVFILAGVGLFLTWFVAMPACIVERLGSFRSMGRSRRLTQRHRLKIFALALLAVATGPILFGIVAVIFGVTGALVPPIAVDRRLLLVAATGIWLAALSAFLGALLAVTYHGLRLAKEGAYADQIATIFE